MPVLIEMDGCVIEHGDCQRAEREIAAQVEQTPVKKTRLSVFLEKLNIRRNR